MEDNEKKKKMKMYQLSGDPSSGEVEVYVIFLFWFLKWLWFGLFEIWSKYSFQKQNRLPWDDSKGHLVELILFIIYMLINDSGIILYL